MPVQLIPVVARVVAPIIARRVGGKVAARAAAGFAARVGGKIAGRVGASMITKGLFSGGSDGAKAETSNQSPQQSILKSAGVAGTAGQQKVATGGGTLPAPKITKAGGYSVNTPTNELLDIAVKYLISINSTLKEQLEFDKKIYDEQVMAEREKLIENKSVFSAFKDKFSDMMGKGSKGGLLLGLLAGAAALAFVADAIFDNEYFKKLKDAVLETSSNFVDKISSFIRYFGEKLGIVSSDATPHPLEDRGIALPNFGGGAQEKPADAVKETAKTTGSAYQIVGGAIGISQSDWNTFSSTIAGIESNGDYSIAGGSGNHYDGKYQIGRDAKIEAGKILGIELAHDKNSRAQFRSNPELQEKTFAALTLANHRRLMKNPKYANASKSVKLQILAYAHNQGAGAANKWINTGNVTKDAFGTKGTKYSDAVAKNLGQSGAAGEATPSTQQAPAPAETTTSDGDKTDTKSDDSILTRAAKFIGNIGSVLVGTGTIRNINASLQKPESKAGDISKASTDIQSMVNYGLNERKKPTALAQIPESVLKIASPSKNISVVNPNYQRNESVMRYSAHYKMAIA